MPKKPSKCENCSYLSNTPTKGTKAQAKYHCRLLKKQISNLQSKHADCPYD